MALTGQEKQGNRTTKTKGEREENNEPVRLVAVFNNFTSDLAKLFTLKPKYS